MMRLMPSMPSSPEKATEYLYQLSIANNYIAKSKVDKNLALGCPFPERLPLEISINLSKPEKNNKDIAKLKTMKSRPAIRSAFLCKENVGFEGSASHPARESIRFIPLTLGGRTLVSSIFALCLLFAPLHRVLS
jgi:UDPglucose--hexose-1-phosphate uridylyltransferase